MIVSRPCQRSMSLPFPQMHPNVNSFDSCVIFLVSSWMGGNFTLSAAKCSSLWFHKQGEARTVQSPHVCFSELSDWVVVPRAHLVLVTEDSKNSESIHVRNRWGQHSRIPLPLSDQFGGSLEGLTTALFHVIKEEWGTAWRKKENFCRTKGSGWRIKMSLWLL